MEKQQAYKGICSICKFTAPLSEVQLHFILEHVEENANTELDYELINVPSKEKDTSISKDENTGIFETENTGTFEAEKTSTFEAANTSTSEQADSTKIQCETDTVRWAPQDVLLLIRLVEENSAKFESSLKKHVWMHISKKISDMIGKTITPEQVDNKWKGLKKTYKKIKDHNKKTGRGTAKWEFFNAMDNCLGKRPEVTPVAVCDTASGLTINKVDVRVPEQAGPSSLQSSSSSVMQKRKRVANDIQRRHEEKLARYDTFLSLFRQSVEHQIGKKPE